MFGVEVEDPNAPKNASGPFAEADEPARASRAPWVASALLAIACVATAMHGQSRVREEAGRTAAAVKASAELTTFLSEAQKEAKEAKAKVVALETENAKLTQALTDRAAELEKARSTGKRRKHFARR